MNFVKIFDLYGSYFNLRIGGNGKFRSIVGGYLSLITIGVFLWTIFSFGGDFYLRKNPKITIENGLYSNADIPVIEPNTLDQDKLIILRYRKEFSKLMVPYISYLNETIPSYNYLNECSLNFLSNNSFINGERDSEMYSYYCINLNNYKIGANEVEKSNYSPLMVMFDDCKSLSTDYIIENNLTSCDQSFNQTFSFISLQLFYQNIGFSPSKENPFNKQFTFRTMYLYNDKSNYINVPISLYSLNDDKGWITNAIENSLDFSFNSPDVLLIPIQQPSSYPEISMYLFISNTYTTYSRTYTKIQDLLATIGGFMKLVFTLLSILTEFIRSYSINNFIVDRIFDMGINKGFQVNNPQDNLRKKSLRNNFLQLSKSPAKDRSSTLRMLDHTFSKFSVDEKYKRKYTSNNQIGLYSYYKASLYLCLNKSVAAKTRREKQLIQVMNKIKISDKMRDFNTIMDKMIEVDMMKSMMLNDHQSLCLNYLQKPRNIPLDNNPHRFSVLLDKTDTNTHNIEEYFLKTLKEHELTHYDKFLFEHLDNEIKMRILSNFSLFKK